MTSGGRARTTSRALAKDDLHAARISVARQLVRPLGRLDIAEIDDAALDLRDRLLRDHEDVPGLEPSHAPSRVDEQRGEIVAGFELRDARGARSPAPRGHGRPVILTPACPR